MTLNEALKQSKCRRFLRKSLIEYGQTQLSTDDELVCAAIVSTVRRETGVGSKRPSYLEKAGSSTKTKMLVCVTTERILLVSYLFGSRIVYELAFRDAPRLDASGTKGGIGLGSLTLRCGQEEYFFSGNRKLMNHLKSGIMAAFMIYGDHIAH